MKASLQQMRDKVLHRNRISSSVLITVRKLSGAFDRNVRGLLLQTFLRMLPAIGFRVKRTKAGVLVYFLYRCYRIKIYSGYKGLVLYLKACAVLVQQSIGGMVIESPFLLKVGVSRTNTGLPRIIPSAHRALIRKGDMKTIKFWLTLFNLYRILNFPGTVKLETITDGFKGDSTRPVFWYIVSCIPAFIGLALQLAGPLRLKQRAIKPRMINKSAPGTGLGTISTHPWVLFTQAQALEFNGLSDPLVFMLEYYEGDDPENMYPDLAALYREATLLVKTRLPSIVGITIGKLGFKEEAAGKVRVFAMVDAWTQWALEPFHEELFRILDHFPQDGTHDQMGPLQRTAKPAFSLDLSSATDRLPMAIQVQLVSALVGGEFAGHWMRLMVDRDYSARNDKYGVNTKVRYSVGQPMGALSSWAMLAFTHHFIVHVAAWHSGVVPVGTLFKGYAVLGDDLVIYDSKVKDSYLEILAALGVECGLHKSLLSPKGLAQEFAKRTIFKGQDVSPVPIEEFVVANLTLGAALEYARKYKLTFPQLIKTLGYGYRVLGGLDRHVGLLNSRVRSVMFGMFLPETEADVRQMLMLGQPRHLTDDILGEVVRTCRDTIYDSIIATVKQRLKKVGQLTGLTASMIDVCMTRARYNLFPETLLNMVASGEISGVPALSDGPIERYFDYSRLYTQGPPPKWTTLRFYSLDDLNRFVKENLASGDYQMIVTQEGKMEVLHYAMRPKEAKEIEVTPFVYDLLKPRLYRWRELFRKLSSVAFIPEVMAVRDGLHKLGHFVVRNVPYALFHDGPANTRPYLPVYLQAMANLRELARLEPKVPSFTRVDPPMPWKSQPQNYRFWVLFTKSILTVSKNIKGTSAAKTKS